MLKVQFYSTNVINVSDVTRSWYKGNSFLLFLSSEHVHCCDFTEAVIRLVISVVVGVATVAVLVDHFRSVSAGLRAHTSPSVP